jgi:hypothetical protein
VARANFALIDHVEGKSNAVEVIRSRRWDYVVLQQGPSSLPLSRDTLILATGLLDTDIQAAGGRSAELMVWPTRDNIASFDQVRVSYQEAAAPSTDCSCPRGRRGGRRGQPIHRYRYMATTDFTRPSWARFWQRWWCMRGSRAGTPRHCRPAPLPPGTR